MVRAPTISTRTDTLFPTMTLFRSQYCRRLARTDWDAIKHKGLSFFVLDIEQPGVSVQPLRQMNGHASFNQVVFTNAEIAPEFIVGETGEGWKIATTTDRKSTRLNSSH